MCLVQVPDPACCSPPILQSLQLPQQRLSYTSDIACAVPGYPADIGLRYHRVMSRKKITTRVTNNSTIYLHTHLSDLSGCILHSFLFTPRWKGGLHLHPVDSFHMYTPMDASIDLAPAIVISSMWSASSSRNHSLANHQLDSTLILPDHLHTGTG